MTKLYCLLKIHNHKNKLEVFLNQLIVFLVMMSLLVMKEMINVLNNKLLILILDKIKLIMIKKI